MKSVQEQILSKCIHFTGIQNKVCEAGISYDAVRGVDRPYKFPCLNQGGECKLCQFPTKEEAAAEDLRLTEAVNRTVGIYNRIKSIYQNTGETSGKIQCLCGGEIGYAIAEINQHISAKCSKCDVSFME
jgi:hypothetical protein